MVLFINLMERAWQNLKLRSNRCVRYNQIFAKGRNEFLRILVAISLYAYLSFRGFFLRPPYIFQVNILPQRYSKMKRSYVSQNANENLETLRFQSASVLRRIIYSRVVHIQRELRKGNYNCCMPFGDKLYSNIINSYICNITVKYAHFFKQYYILYV